MIKDKFVNNENVSPNTRELETLKSNFPQFFDKDGEFLLDRFKNMLGQSDISISKEGYELNFLGKSYARYLSSTETETFIAPLESDNESPENKESENLYIIGDNIDALKHLLNSYAGKIKCVYIDPPYNTGSDGFVYPDNFSFNARELSNAIGIEEEEAERILNLAGKSSHSAWLTFIYPRLILARELLSDDGVIFISIDDNEQANLKMACDEVFGEENFVGLIPWRKRTAKADVPFGVSQDYEVILGYAKNDGFLASVEGNKRKYHESDDYPNRPWRIHDLTKQTNAEERPNSFFTIVDPRTKKEYPANPNATWRVTKDTFDKYYESGRIVFPDDYDFLNISRPVMRYFKDDDMAKDGEHFGRKALSTHLPDKVGMSLNGTKEIIELFETKIFNFPKPSSLLHYLFSSCLKENDIILDFFSGSATTAHAVMQLNAEDGGNRKYIMVQIPEIIDEKKPAYKAGYRTIDEIGRERIRRAAKKIKKETNADIDYGFKTFKLENISQNTLNKMIDFDPTPKLFTEDMISVFDSKDSSGLSSILATWLNQDGYGLNSKAKDYKLNDYKAKLYEDSLYIIEEHLKSEDVMKLIERLETLELDINRIVVYAYSVDFSTMHELKKNIKNLRNNKSVEIIERY